MKTKYRITTEQTIRITKVIEAVCASEAMDMFDGYFPDDMEENVIHEGPTTIETLTPQEA